MLKPVILVAAFFSVPVVASANTITIDNFENGNLNAWNPVLSGQIVVDPLNGSNHALHFTALGNGGDTWTATPYAVTGNDWWFSFDYLGQPAAGAFTGSGGFIGWDTDQIVAGTERWLAGTTSTLGTGDISLIDDGAWHSYVIHLTRGVNLPSSGGVYFKAEDYLFSDAIAGNAYFDNVRISDVDPRAAVPEAGTLALLATGLGLLARRIRR